MALLRAVDAAEADAFRALIVQDFEGVAVKDRHDGAGEVGGEGNVGVAKGQLFEQLDVAKVSPFIVENHGLAGVLLIPLFLLNSVVFEEFEHKFSTPGWGESLAGERVCSGSF